MRGAQSAPPHPLVEPGDVPEAQGAYLGGLARGETKPVLVKMQSLLWGAPLWSFVGWPWINLVSSWRPWPTVEASSPPTVRQ
jgi:hypothetical protein